MKILDNINFDEKGLVPAIAQDYNTGEVLMMAYMNREALEKTFETGKACYFSRSRGKQWMKGESSGHVQNVKEAFIDCDGDTILLKVEQTVAACHTGHYTCFYRKMDKDSIVEISGKTFDEGKVYGD